MRTIPKNVGKYMKPDVTVERIGDLLEMDVGRMVAGVNPCSAQGLHSTPRLACVYSRAGALEDAL